MLKRRGKRKKRNTLAHPLLKPEATVVSIEFEIPKRFGAENATTGQVIESSALFLRLQRASVNANDAANSLRENTTALGTGEQEKWNAKNVPRPRCRTAGPTFPLVLSNNHLEYATN